MAELRFCRGGGGTGPTFWTDEDRFWALRPDQICGRGWYETLSGIKELNDKIDNDEILRNNNLYTNSPRDFNATKITRHYNTKIFFNYT